MATADTLTIYTTATSDTVTFDTTADNAIFFLLCYTRIYAQQGVNIIGRYGYEGTCKKVCESLYICARTVGLNYLSKSHSCAVPFFITPSHDLTRDLLQGLRTL